MAFVLFGPLRGLVAGLLALNHGQLVELWSVHPGISLGGTVYLLEGWTAWWLYRRTRSLPLAIAIFWLGFGWIADWLIYVAWVGLAPAYVFVLFVKQLLNGVLYGTAVDLLAMRPVRAFAARVDGRRAETVDIAHYAFRGGMVLAMLPVALVALMYARAQYAGVLEAEEQVNSEIGYQVATRTHAHMEVERYQVEDLVRQLEGAGTATQIGRILEQHLADRPESDIVAVVDRDGVILAAHPPTSIDGVPLAGADITDRAYFREVRASSRTTYSNLIIGRFPMRRQAVANTAVVIAEPRLDDEGSFAGALIWSIELTYLLHSVIPPEMHGRSLTLIDQYRRVIVSSDGERASGSLLELRPSTEHDADDPRGLETQLGNRRAALHYYPPAEPTLASSLGLDLVHAVYQPIVAPNWGVLVDLPASRLHEQFLPTAQGIAVLFVLLVTSAYLLVRRFASRLTDPVRSAATVAQQVHEGRLDPQPVAAMERSDLTEMRALGAAFGELDRALQRQRRETAEREEDLQSQLLEAQKMEAIGLLAGGVAHDFNNMLTPILGYADLGAASAHGQEEREYFEKIRAAAKEAARVTAQLLAFGRRQVLDMESVDLVAEIEQCRPLLRPLLRENIELRIHTRVERAPVLVDTAQFHRILFNLSLNAQDAMQDGGSLTIEVDVTDSAPHSIGDEARAVERYVVVSVRDTGSGIEPALQRQIFEPFFTTKGPEKGTGLGLATVYGIVKQHGGGVDVSSRPGHGSTFRVFLPEVVAGSQRPASAESPRPATTRSHRILVAEDDTAVRTVIASFLTGHGFEVSAHADAESALEALRRQPFHFDALVTDVVLPAMNGRELWDAVQHLRPGFPTLFISGYGHEVLASQGLPHGVHLLSKPFTQADLLRSLDQVLEPGVSRVGRDRAS